MSTENTGHDLEQHGTNEAVNGEAGGEVEGYLLHPSQALPPWYLRLPPVYQPLPTVPPLPNPGPLFIRPA